MHSTEKLMQSVPVAILKATPILVSRVRNRKQEKSFMTGNILIVDDNPDNLRVLEGMLTAQGYEVRAAISGEVALKAISARLPDIILVDIMMPGMNGFEVCRRLQDDPDTSYIPVLFISALAEAAEKVRAFEVGGVDYITKPFSEQEVLARVKTHLRLTMAQRDLQKTNLELMSEIEARKQAEESLAESSFRLSQIIESVPVPTFVIDADHVITHWNKAIEKMTGLPASRMIGTKDQWQFFYSERRPVMADLVLDGNSGDEIPGYYEEKVRKSVLVDGAFEVEVYLPNCGLDGKWFFLTAAPLTYRSGAIVGVIETTQDITEQKLAEERLKLSEQRYKEQSITDSLTELYNSRYFFRQLEYEVERAKRYGSSLSLILLDIDDFKKYNDTYGHQEGDKVLKALSNVLKNSLRNTDTPCRYGGEEFTIILPETPGENALIVAERVRGNFAHEILIPTSGTEAHMTVSVGVTQYVCGEDSKELLKRADEAMYEAKNNGKNRIRCDKSYKTNKDCDSKLFKLN